MIHFALCNILTFSLKMLRVNLFQFCINILVKIFTVKILYLGKYLEFFLMIFVLFYSLICHLYHHANNSISTIGYLFMRGVTYMLYYHSVSGNAVVDQMSVDQLSQ